MGGAWCVLGDGWVLINGRRVEGAEQGRSIRILLVHTPLPTSPTDLSPHLSHLTSLLPVPSFKVHFGKQIQGHDTVCLNLFKRVFPKVS